MMIRLIILFFCLMTVVPLSAKETLCVVIDKQDIAVLGNWPLHRKWYATALQNLKFSGANRIFLDIAFPTARPLQRESDAFFYSLLTQYPEIHLLSHKNRNASSDSIKILGRYSFPKSRTIAPFSDYVDIQGNQLLIKTDISNSLVHYLKQETLPQRKLIISMPTQHIEADYHFTDILRETIECEAKDVFIMLDYPGVTSYVVNPAAKITYSTSALQIYAANQILDGNYAYAFPKTALTLLFLSSLFPFLWSRRKHRVFHAASASFLMMIILLVLLKIFKIYTPPLFYLFLIIPVVLCAIQIFRQKINRRQPAKETRESGWASQLNEKIYTDYKELKEKLRFYEHLIDQKKTPEANNLPAWLQLAPSSPLHEILKKVEQIALTDIPVLITGESGTGKEQVAKFLHERSPRSQHPFVAVHCASLNENLIESELFGYMPGAFTGATRLKKGKFDQANGGTLFLDEICETSLSVQIKLLRFLQEGVFERVGGIGQIQTSIRIVAATNRNPLKAIQQEIFREDFYYRLNGYTIAIPPLRERKMDIEHLFRFFLHEEDPEIKISASIISWLKEQTWPGNVRELKAAIKRALINAKLQNRRFLLPDDFEINDSNPSNSRHQLLHKKIIEHLREDGFRHRSISGTAYTLGIHRTTVIEYLRGWTIRFLQLSDLKEEPVYNAIAGESNLENPAKFRQRIQGYIESTRKNILAGIRADMTKEMIRHSYFKKLPSEFQKDLTVLIEKIQSQSK